MTVAERTVHSPSMSWWSHPPVGWSDVCDAIYSSWHRIAKSKLDEDVAKRAITFGYGARAAYGAHRSWQELEPQLEADWQGASSELEHPWKHVRNAAHGGWLAAGADAESAFEDTASASPSLELRTVSVQLETTIPTRDAQRLPVLERLLRVGDTYTRNGAPHQAYAVYLELADRDADTAVGHAARERLIAIAEDYEREGKSHHARSVYEQLLRLAPAPTQQRLSLSLSRVVAG